MTSEQTLKMIEAADALNALLREIIIAQTTTNKALDKIIDHVSLKPTASVVTPKPAICTARRWTRLTRPRTKH